MAKKSSSRTRACAKIAREKAMKMRRRLLLKRIGLGVAGFSALYILGGGWWFIASGGMARTLTAMTNSFYSLTADAGFRIEHVYLDGRKHTPMHKVQEALALSLGTPIFSASPSEIRAKLEMLDRVGHAEVERVLPGTLHIRLVEREPVAIWQNRGKLALLDETGKVIEAKTENYRGLPVLVGEDAPIHVAELMQFLGYDRSLFTDVQAAVRVSGRRWNVRLKDGIEIKLPEHNPADAWKELVAMQQRDKVLERAISVVDMRLAGKVFLKTTASTLGDPKFAKET